MSEEPSWGKISVIVNTYKEPKDEDFFFGFKCSGDKFKNRDWETILLVTLPLIGLGTLLLLGHLDFPIIEQVKNIPVSFSDFNGSFHFK